MDIKQLPLNIKVFDFEFTSSPRLVSLSSSGTAFVFLHFFVSSSFSAFSRLSPPLPLSSFHFCLSSSATPSSRHICRVLSSFASAFFHLPLLLPVAFLTSSPLFSSTCHPPLVSSPLSSARKLPLPPSFLLYFASLRPPSLPVHPGLSAPFPSCFVLIGLYHINPAVLER